MNKEAIEAMVAVDLGVRLAMVVAAKVLSSEEMEAAVKATEELSKEAYSEDPAIVSETFTQLRKALHMLAKLK